MSVDLLLAILAGACGIASIIDDARARVWAGVGILLLAIALIV